MSLINQYRVGYRTKINHGDAPYGRNDKIAAVDFYEGIDSDSFAEYKAPVYFEDDFSNRQERAMYYALSRIASICDLWDHTLYQAEVMDGYYGEEVRGVRHTHEDKAEKRIETCQNLISEDKIRELVFQLLEWEYGYVLDSLKEAEFNEERVHIDDLETPNKRYAGKVDPDGYYVSTDWPIGVYLDGEVVDGYNRYVTLKGNTSDVWIYNFS
jgi:hypothetical protein